MFALENKNVLVIGLGLSGLAATELSLSRGANVTVVDSGNTEGLQERASRLRQRGVQIELGATTVPLRPFDLAVLSPGVPLDHSLVTMVQGRKIPLIGELELGYQQSLALNISITGTNGKTTTTELVETMLTANRLKTMAAGNIGTPLCAIADRARELDFITLEVSSFQLETIQFFRPAVAVLMNITPDHLDRYASMDDYARAKARIFENQQAFDWAIIQSEALAQLVRIGAKIPSKVITFSAADQKGDFYLDRGLIISRMEQWSGPVLNMEDVRLRGPHNAENIMAALAVGRVLRLPLEGMLGAIKSYEPAPHRCEIVGEIDGVEFVNDSKATNVDAVAKALMAVSRGEDSREPNVWLLAGGKDKGFDYHDVGPLLSRRAKGAFLFGETSEKIRAAWSLFTTCTIVPTLLEAVTEAAKRARPGDVVLLSPACSSFDQFRNYQHRGEVFREAVNALKTSKGTRQKEGPAGPSGRRLEALML
jgi:UDP-N-acetylmuramoylalanine--D-glutamate ligase